MAGAVSEVRIRGLKELNTVLRRASKDLRREVTETIRDAGEPVRMAAETLAFGHGATGRITGIREDDKWGRMRLGYSMRDAIVYIAPKEHGVKFGLRKRRDFGPLLLEEAMIPALEDNADKIEALVQDALDDLAHFWRFTG